MITSRRDYILRIIDEVGRLVARIIFKRRSGANEEALETVIQGFQRLFDLEADQIFLLTPEQQFALLVRDEPPEIARDKALLYAALSAEAGHIYTAMGNKAMARATFTNALRFTLKARTWPSEGDLPAWAPSIPVLLQTLADQPLDADTAELLRTYS